MTNIITDLRRNGIVDYILLQAMYYYLNYNKANYINIIIFEAINLIVLLIHISKGNKIDIHSKYLIIAINSIGLFLKGLSPNNIVLLKSCLLILFAFLIRNKLKKYNSIHS